MEITNPDSMAKFAEDVRQQETPFTEAASELFTSLFKSEYKRLRAAALESGESSAVLSVSCRCNFDAGARSVEMESKPAPYLPKPHKKALPVR